MVLVAVLLSAATTVAACTGVVLLARELRWWRGVAEEAMREEAELLGQELDALAERVERLERGNLRAVH